MVAVVAAAALGTQRNAYPAVVQLRMIDDHEKTSVAAVGQAKTAVGLVMTAAAWGCDFPGLQHCHY